MTRVAVTDDDAAEVDLVLHDAGIAGLVVDDRGRPVEGAEVGARASDVNGDVTDSQGRFDLGAFPPGEYEVTASWPRQYDGRRCGEDRTTVRTGDLAVRLGLPRPATITGRVLLDGAPLPYFGVLLTQSPRFTHIGDPTGVRTADGRFELRGVPPGTWGLVVAGPGTSLHTLGGIAVAAGAHVDLGDLGLSRGHRVSGIVRDAAGEPVAAARVAIGGGLRHESIDHDPLQCWFREEAETTSGADGRFVLDGVAARSPGTHPRPIAAVHPEHGASRELDLPDGDADVELTLLPTGAIDGVVDGHGPDRLVTVMARCGRESEWTTQVDRAGRFQLDGLPPGDYEVELIVPSRDPIVARTTTTVAAGQRAAVGLALPPRR